MPFDGCHLYTARGVYTARGAAALLVPLANVLTSATGGWNAVVYVAAVLSILAALLAVFTVKLRRMHLIAEN
jgi:MFS transporter, OFA family, oxalate/formate antiporter